MTERDRYIRVDEVAARTGINPRTLTRRLALGEIPVLRDPIDLRWRMIAKSDLEKLTALQPRTHRKSERPTAA